MDQITFSDTFRQIVDTLKLMADSGCEGFDCSEKSLSTIKSWERKQEINRPARKNVPVLEKRSVQRKQSVPVKKYAPINKPVLKNTSVLENQVKANQTDTLEGIWADIGDCMRCPLCQKRNKIVFGAGNPEARLVFIGEAPGHDEDLTGQPFVGKAGQLLTKIIQAMNLVREQVYICNIVKCRPPGNRNPQPEEIKTCIPFLLRQISVIKPDFICCLGAVAAHAFLNTTTPISKLRGRFYDYHEKIKVIPTYHPSYLLYNPDKKRETWEDMKMLMRLMG
ncbi:uracil-DNA glycosylase [Desulfobacterales bacterium HSG16]|nr:uracil-DNA glycosylase [Desulfobacterales bacterium HSG16]